MVPLPPWFELADLRKAKVAPNYHVQGEGNFYSVPARLIGKALDVRLTTMMVEVFDGAERVASHPRLNNVKGQYQTVTEHMPPAHRAQLRDWTPARFTSWAGEIGPNTVRVIEAILASKPVVEQAYRSCLGVMSYATKTGGHTRLSRLRPSTHDVDEPVLRPDQAPVAPVEATARRTEVTRGRRVRARSRLLRHRHHHTDGRHARDRRRR